MFSILENKISLCYHLEKGRITSNTREFLKPDTSDDSIAPKFDPECTTAFKVDPTAPDPKNYQLFQLLTELLAKEEASIVDVSGCDDIIMFKIPI